MDARDVSTVEDVLGSAFAKNPVTRFLFGDGDGVAGRVRLFNRGTVRNRRGRGVLAEINGQAVGALLEADWPNCEPRGLEGLRFTWDAVRALRWRLVSGMSMFRGITKSHPEWPHRHLSVLGVLPEFHGRGVGSTLLTDFCARADSDGAGAYLETDSDGGVRLYRRFGFQVVKVDRFDGVEFSYMWRQPADNSRCSLKPAPSSS